MSKLPSQPNFVIFLPDDQGYGGALIAESIHFVDLKMVLFCMMPRIFTHKL